MIYIKIYLSYFRWICVPHGNGIKIQIFLRKNLPKDIDVLFIPIITNYPIKWSSPIGRIMAKYICLAKKDNIQSDTCILESEIVCDSFECITDNVESEMEPNGYFLKLRLHKSVYKSLLLIEPDCTLYSTKCSSCYQPNENNSTDIAGN